MKSIGMLVLVLLTLVGCAGSVAVDETTSSDEPAAEPAAVSAPGAGPAGPRGARGPRGLPGAGLDPERVYVVTGDWAEEIDGIARTEIRCDDGAAPLGGGCELMPSDPPSMLTASAPTSFDDGTAIGWRCHATGAGPAIVRAYALCLDVDP